MNSFRHLWSNGGSGAALRSQIGRSRNWLRQVRRMQSCERGSIQMIASICIIPLLVFIGVTVDYGRALTVQAELQNAIDSAALMVAKTSNTMTAAQIESQTTTFMAALFNVPTTTGTTVTATASGTANRTVTVTATTNMQTTLTQLLGITTLPISATSTVSAAASARQRVALVLDNSGSMADSGKLTALQSAANAFLTQLHNATTTTDDVYVSIVPFNNEVNVGSSNSSASWLDTSGISGGGGWGWGWGWGWGGGTSWGGCVTDRGNSSGPSSGNYDTNVSPPVSGNSATLFPADNPTNCPQQILPLTNNWTTLSTQINSMIAAGNTNQAIGLAHGWMSLVGGGPYPTPPTEDPAYKYQHTVILLSDGLNTADRWYSFASSIDARQLITCNNMKTAGVTIYTIQVNTTGDPTSSILQSCASDSTKFFLLTSSTQIPTVFNTIGNQLNQLRLTN